MRKKWQKIGSNELDPDTTTNKHWGFRPVPNKFGKTTNAKIFNKEDKKDA